MKNLLLSLFIVLSLGLHAQNEAIKAQIDSAKTYDQMPVLNLTLTRDAGKILYRFVNGKAQQINKDVLTGEVFTLYCPVWAHSTQDKEHIYRLASTSPIISDSTVMIDYFILTPNVNRGEGDLLTNWRYKYLSLYQKQPKAPKAPEVRTGTSPAWLIFDRERNLVKIYGAVEDCISFCSTENDRKPIAGRVMPSYSDQQVNLHYQRSDTAWQPTMRDVMEDYNHPQGLSDKFLAKKTVYVVMQNHFKLALMIYENQDDCREYVDSRGDGKPTVLEVSYFYRVQKSYDEIWRIRKKQLGMK